VRPLLLTSLLAIASIAVLPAATASAAPPGETARASACSTVSYDGRTYVMYRQGIGCRSARRKVRYVHRNKELPGWRCQSGTNFRTGGGCSRGRKLFGWHPAD
jgi:hypothetical protein